MSVTITIANNNQYCEQNNLVEYDEYEGEKFPSYPYELNLANANFAAFGNALGLIDNNDDSKWCGSIYSQKLALLLKNFDPELSVRARNEEKIRGGGILIDCGLDLDQITRYIVLLEIMVVEAERREEKIVWC